MLTIGADPEFGLLKQGKAFIPANGLIPADEHDKEFGCDGCSSIAEIRPNPASDPIGLVRNISSVLESGARRGWIPLSYEWRAGSVVNSYPVGGHIHFGVGATNELTSSLDTYLAHTLALIEKPERAKYRRHRFGVLGETRDQPHGFEYRPPSSWLVSPEIATGVLSLAYVVVNGALEGKLSNGHTIDNGKYFEHDYDYLRDIHEEAKREVVKLAEYHKYQPFIDYIYSLINQRQTWDDNADIRQTWGFISRFEGLKRYAFEDPDEIFDLRRVPLSPAGYADLSLNLKFEFKDHRLPEISHRTQSLIEVRDNGLSPNLSETGANLLFYGLREEPNRPQIKINGRIPRARKLGSYLREKGYEVEVAPKYEHIGVGLRADMRNNIEESARLVLLIALSASGITRLGRRERVIEYRFRGG